MAIAKEQVTQATVVAMEQVVMAVVRAVSWCICWCGEISDALSLCGRHQKQPENEQEDSFVTTESRLKGYWILV
uniref:Uncharacterized protein n=1 Tax=Nothobranchius pienaari TaxID=704102 RepID=A0A1A8N7X5_9TELE